MLKKRRVSEKNWGLRKTGEIGKVTRSKTKNWILIRWYVYFTILLLLLVYHFNRKYDNTWFLQLQSERKTLWTFLGSYWFMGTSTILCIFNYMCIWSLFFLRFKHAIFGGMSAKNVFLKGPLFRVWLYVNTICETRAVPFNTFWNEIAQMSDWIWAGVSFVTAGGVRYSLKCMHGITTLVETCMGPGSHGATDP